MIFDILALMTLPLCEVIHLGLVEYQVAWDLQNQFAGQIASGERPPTLLLLQHPHTYTFGRRGKAEHLLWDQVELDQRQAQVYWVDRGGDVTYHGPGQLVGYPLLPLAPGGIVTQRKANEKPPLPQADYVGYLRRLEQVLVETLRHFHLPAFPIEGLTGVWVASRAQAEGTTSPPAKIAALGVKVDVHGISRHGFALNVAPDMSYWQGIIACGLVDTPVTSMAEQVQPVPTLEQICQPLISIFGTIFRYQMIEKTVSLP